MITILQLNGTKSWCVHHDITKLESSSFLTVNLLVRKVVVSYEVWYCWKVLFIVVFISSTIITIDIVVVVSPTNGFIIPWIPNSSTFTYWKCFWNFVSGSYDTWHWFLEWKNNWSSSIISLICYLEQFYWRLSFKKTFLLFFLLHFTIKAILIFH